LCGCTVSVKLPKIPLFRPFLIHQLRLLGSQQHPQSGVLLTAFSNRGTENSLEETIWRIWGVIKGCNIFWGKKLAYICSFMGGRIIMQQQKNLKNRTQLDEPVERASQGDPLPLYKILHLLFFPPVLILCALCLESWEKTINIVLMWDLWNFSFFG